MNKHDFVCINCPLSCSLELREEAGEIVEVKGSDCKLGEKYAAEEFKDPRRVLTTTVNARGGIVALLPVHSVGAIPKRLVRDAVRALAGVTVDAPVAFGQVIAENILDTGVDVVSSRELENSSGHSDD
ncbi:MAG: molybdopterin oxidoreductase [Alphaproteobacteria bacterium HGW-Alphaproteobacteria-13]|nr:MAG: molybdopterin oxidoreductase [Alphaproteobacteria bacterium HGW-Alphaproteobacteria-13]